MDTVTVRGSPIGFERVGSGPPLVLLHGYVGDGRATFGPQIEDLSDEFTVVVWDAPGAGASGDPPEDLGMGGYADVLGEFLASLGIETAHVGGVSMGGALAVAFAQRHPTRVRSLVLLSAYAGWGGSLSPVEATRRLEQAYTLSRLGPQEFVAALLPTMFAEGVSEDRKATFAASLAGFHPAGFRALATASAADLRAGLAAIQAPTLLVYGEIDVRAPRQVAKALADAIPESQLVFVPDAGHVITLEQPEAVNDLVRRFLASQRPQTGR